MMGGGGPSAAPAAASTAGGGAGAGAGAGAMRGGGEVFCVCRTADITGTMLECDFCEDWFHVSG